MKNIYTLLMMLFSLSSIAQTYVWTQKTPPPFGTNGRQEHNLFSIGGMVYLAMGTDSGVLNTYNDMWEYNPSTDLWVQMDTFPYQGSHGTSSFVINNDAYIVGGWGSTQTIQCNRKYTPATNSYALITAFPDANRYDGAAFALNGKGYYGTGYSPSTNDLWEYDAANNTWTQKASMPGSARQGAVGFSIGNYGYITTGAAAGGTPVYSDTWRYDPVNNTWLQRTSFPGAARSHGSAFVLNNEAFVIGGSDFTSSGFNDVYKYDPAADSWIFIGLFPGGPRHHSSAAASSNGKGYFGQGGYSVPSLNEWYTTNDWWEFEIITGIEENENAVALNIYPNPASTEITLDTKTLPSSMHIYNMKGQLMQALKPSSEKITIDVSSFASGNYVVQAFSGKKVITQKFVKE